MTYLLDTNVISELAKRNPHAGVASFLSAHRETMWLSVLSLGEIRRGIAMSRVRSLVAAEAIERWLLALEVEFADRLLPVTAQIAERWGTISADRSRPVVDTLLAATALVHNLSVVTRNVRDFRELGVCVINPWDA